MFSLSLFGPDNYFRNRTSAYRMYVVWQHSSSNNAYKRRASNSSSRNNNKNNSMNDLHFPPHGAPLLPTGRLSMLVMIAYACCTPPAATTTTSMNPPLATHPHTATTTLPTFGLFHSPALVGGATYFILPGGDTDDDAEPAAPLLGGATYFIFPFLPAVGGDDDGAAPAPAPALEPFRVCLPAGFDACAGTFEYVHGAAGNKQTRFKAGERESRAKKAGGKVRYVRTYIERDIFLNNKKEEAD